MSDIITAILLVSGSVFVLLASIGLVKFPDPYTRMQTSTKAITLGLGFLLIAVMTFFKTQVVMTTGIVIILFFFLTTPIAAHLLARSAYFQDVPLWKKTVIDEWHDELNKASSANTNK